MSNSRKIIVREFSAGSEGALAPSSSAGGVSPAEAPKLKHVYTIELSNTVDGLPSLTLYEDDKEIFEIIEPAEPIEPERLDLDSKLREVLARYSDPVEYNLRAKLHYAPCEGTEPSLILDELIVRLVLNRPHADEYLLIGDKLSLPADSSDSDHADQREYDLLELIKDLSLDNDEENESSSEEDSGASPSGSREIVIKSVERDPHTRAETLLATYRIRYRFGDVPSLFLYENDKEIFEIVDPESPNDPEDIDDQMQEILDRFQNSTEGNIRAALHWAPYDEIESGDTRMYLFDELIVRLVLNRPHSSEYILAGSSLSVPGGVKGYVLTDVSEIDELDIQFYFSQLIDDLNAPVDSESSEAQMSE